ncbi:hypothetical protein [Pseudoalteromonas sp. S16_S37]|uniref:hypothetical protein n=1 Tax=Pseudoalteromonas sp. S16_S37 TaxID=2720228 RepID=UPI001681B470|nr:hypothetical protein [Pseudoalteromonas sp. S16_S37]MBD1582510.1 hypothetical protein [Pseudoalteromonas sp. S16_S37]
MAYSIGTISIQQNNAIITGTNTLFERVAKAQVGDLLYVHANAQDMILQVSQVVSDTQLRVAMLDGKPFMPTFSASGLGYGLVQNFTATTTAKLAKGIADLQTKWHQRESQLTGWFSSTDDTYPITTFLGEQNAIPTPTKIAELAQVAMTASADLANMAQTIEANKQSLATVEPRIAQFDAVYPQVISASNSVTAKHDEVVTAHATVHTHANTIAEQVQQVSAAQQVVFSLKADIEQAAQQVDLDQAHSQAAAALCTVAQSQTHSDAQTVSADKTAVEQLKSELLTLSSTLNASMANAQLQISSSAQQTQTQATQKQQAIESTASNAKASIEQTAKQFTQQTVAIEQNTQRYAYNAMAASNQCTLAVDAVTHRAAESHQTLAHAQTLANTVFTTSEQVSRHAQAAELSALHSKASMALCALSVKTLSEQNSNIATAFGAVLDNTLTTEQINQLFPA